MYQVMVKESKNASFVPEGQPSNMLWKAVGDAAAMLWQTAHPESSASYMGVRVEDDKGKCHFQGSIECYDELKPTPGASKDHDAKTCQCVDCESDRWRGRGERAVKGGAR